MVVTAGGVPVPDEVRQALTGRPQVGEWELIVPFLTVDPAGFPHVCLLSRAELEADELELRAVIFGQNTIANLERQQRATLVVVLPEAAWYCKLRLARSLPGPDGWLGAVLTVESVKRDTAGVTLAPARFEPTQDLARAESWRRSERLLARMRPN